MSVNTCLHILIVDDDLDMGAAFDHMLAKFSPTELTYKIVANPYDALLDMANNEYDLMFIDINIPEISGHELLSRMDDFIQGDRTIQNSNLYENKVPVILMSSSANLLKRDVDLKHFYVQHKVLKQDMKSFILSRLAQYQGNLNEDAPAQ